MSRTGGPTSGPWPGRDLGHVDLVIRRNRTQIAGPAAPNSDDIRATFTPSSRRRPGDDGTSTAYRTRKLARRGSETPNLHSIDATQYESSRECSFTPSAHLRRDHHAATGPVLLLAPPGPAHPTPLAARRRSQLLAAATRRASCVAVAPSVRRPRGRPCCVTRGL